MTAEEPVGSRAAVLAAVSAGGALGALARHAVSVAVPSPWTTMLVNASGCLLIGVLMAVVESGRAHRLARPFLGVGVLGGFTTFSAYVVDVQRADGPVAVAAQLAVTPVVAVAATWAGSRLARAVWR
ncbi:FluC/FEX family fluoride channel [Spirillospora sp. CA-294931]|uniref:FluC/FEX family fluoride channel n=1 Tax=Spirillospora sp. CA-294931 TaxID=3240042 RepID=UPI003D9385A3